MAAQGINDPIRLVNRYLRRAKREASRAAVDLTVTPPQAGAYAGQINSGDFIYRTANGFVASLNTAGTAKANTASCIGAAVDNYPMRQLDQILPAAINEPTPEIAYRTDGEHLYFTTAGDTYVPGSLVYLGADAQTVTVIATNNGTPVGRVCFDQSRVGVDIGGSVVGDGAGEVVIEITPALAP